MRQWAIPLFTSFRLSGRDLYMGCCRTARLVYTPRYSSILGCVFIWIPDFCDFCMLFLLIIGVFMLPLYSFVMNLYRFNVPNFLIWSTVILLSGDRVRIALSISFGPWSIGLNWADNLSRLAVFRIWLITSQLLCRLLLTFDCILNKLLRDFGSLWFWNWLFVLFHGCKK